MCVLGAVCLCGYMSLLFGSIALPLLEPCACTFSLCSVSVSAKRLSVSERIYAPTHARTHTERQRDRRRHRQTPVHRHTHAHIHTHPFITFPQRRPVRALPTSGWTRVAVYAHATVRTGTRAPLVGALLHRHGRVPALVCGERRVHGLVVCYIWLHQAFLYLSPLGRMPSHL